MEELFYQYNYPSIEKFKKILKDNNVKVSNQEITDFINNQKSSQLHKPVQNIKENKKFIFALSPFQMVQIDLLDYQKYSKQNKGYNFILIAIDIFTRLAYACPIKNKKPESVLEAFESFDIKPLSIFHDSGNEYKGVFLKYLNDNDIVDLKADIGDHNSLGVIDRFSKTFKTIVSKYMTINDTTKYYPEINKIIKSYNNTPHNSLNNIKPDDIIDNKENYDTVNDINFAKMKFNKSVMKKSINNFKVGSYVRIKLKKELFKKGYEVTYSKKSYQIENINGDRAILDDGTTHKLENLLLINNDTGEIITKNKDRIEKEIQVKRKLRREGII